MSNIDYKLLLKKYMNHVGEQEGVDFTGLSLSAASEKFSHFESDELRRISEENKKEHEDKNQTNLFGT